MCVCVCVCVFACKIEPDHIFRKKQREEKRKRCREREGEEDQTYRQTRHEGGVAWTCDGGGEGGAVVVVWGKREKRILRGSAGRDKNNW